MDFNPRTDIPTLAMLSPPVLDYPYFQRCDVSFAPEARDYSSANAWWLAEASFLAYGNADLIARCVEADTLLRREGMQWEPIVGDGDTAGLILHNDQIAMVAFRGTRVLGLQDPLAFQASLAPNLRDIVTDARFLQVAFGSGRVHQGFAYAFEPLVEHLTLKLEAHAEAGRSIWFTGHSLGGALATLAAARFGLGERRGLYTFGSPRVGDAAFGSVLEGQTHFRFVHHDDIIARVPPPPNYAHCGRLVYIDDDGSISPDADPSRLTDLFEGRVDWTDFKASIARRIRDTVAAVKHGVPDQLLDLRVPRGPVTDHAPIYYASFLKEALTNSHR
jgi:triacylglycerol lipase